MKTSSYSNPRRAHAPIRLSHLLAISLLLLGLSNPSSVRAQNTPQTGPVQQGVAPDPAKTGVAALPQPGGALLRWTLIGDTLPDTYRLIREGGSGKVRRDLPGIAPKADAIKNGWVTAQQYDFLKAKFGTPVTDPFEKLGLQLQTLASPGIARTLNLLVTETGLKDGTRYSYRVVAVRGGKETPVGTATVTPGQPPAVPAPGKLSAVPERTRVTVAWQRAGGQVMAYQVYRAEGNATPLLLQPSPYFPTVDPAQPGRVSFKDDALPLKPKTKYSYQVAALDLFGRESARTAVLVADTGDAEPFSRASLVEPVITFGADGRGAVKLMWNAVKDPRILGLMVYRGSSPDTLKPLSEVAAGSSTYTDTTTEEAKSYVYGLGYKLAAGPTGPLSIRGAQPLNPALSAPPKGLKAKLEDANTLTLSWQPAPGKPIGYLVVRGATATTPSEQFVSVTPRPIAATTLKLHLDASPGTGMTFRVITVSASGVSGKPGEPVAVVTPRIGGDAPTLLSVAPQDSALKVTWAYAGAAPAQVEVFRQNPQGDLVLVARLPGTTKVFTDRNVQAPFAYAYLVAALDARGKRSDPSNVSGATPLNITATPLVQGLSVSAGGGGAVLRWTADKGAASYAVYRTRGNRQERLGVVASPTYTDAQGKAGDVYRVVPVEQGGIQGQEASVTFK
ncbi:fibronectin type III domain-containing protein [Deinococcus marmoris]|uniref:fibronectin type III domain-containing protein n=1 Tax=Deinococcus marmoris TaxID=249408 RepID=UPI0004966710|nr:fibronectin type III domain-containing protein [Deinococcus marmoris]